MHTLTIILFALLAVALPLVSLATLTLPFVWCFASWAGASIVLAYGFSHALMRSLFVSLAAALFALMLAEVYVTHAQLKFAEPIRLENVHVTNPDPVLGYVAPSNTKRTARKVNSVTGEVIYEHQVTIGENGLRATLPLDDSSKEAILFLGGSFTYGEGVGDDDTLPAQLGKLTQDRYRVYNFGLHGYGPQNILAAIEHGRVGEIVLSPVRFVFYVAIEDHVIRLAGNKYYLRYGPRYILTENGEAIASGWFHRPGSAWTAIGEKIKTQLLKSNLLMRVWFLRLDESDLRLYEAAVKRMAKLLAETYPEAEFHVLYWNIGKEKEGVNIADRLRLEGISVYEINAEEFPELLADRARYQIAGDGHPTAYWYQLVAESLVRQFIDRTESEPD